MCGDIPAAFVCILSLLLLLVAGNIVLSFVSARIKAVAQENQCDCFRSSVFFLRSFVPIDLFLFFAVLFFSLLSNRENQGIFLSSEMDFKKWMNFSRNGPQQTTPYNFTIAIPLYNVFSNCGRKINECIKGSTIFDYQFRKCEKRKPKIILKRTRNSLLFVVWRIYFDDFQTLFVMFHGFHLSRLLIFNHGECCPVLIKINDETRHTVLLPFLLLMKTHFYRFRLTLDLPRNISLNSHLTS